MLDQATLRRAVAVFSFRDGRDSRLLVRFKAIAQNLECKSGVLGQEREFGTGARQLVRATGKLMVRACKRFDGAPPPSGSARAGRKPFLKKDLLTHLRKTVVGLTCDAAADEVLSAEMMRDPN